MRRHLVADLGALAEHLDVVVVLAMPMVRAGRATTRGDQSDGAGTQDSEQFPTVHGVLLNSCKVRCMAANARLSLIPANIVPWPVGSAARTLFVRAWRLVRTADPPGTGAQ